MGSIFVKAHNVWQRFFARKLAFLLSTPCFFLFFFFLGGGVFIDILMNVQDIYCAKIVELQYKVSQKL